MAVPKAKEGWRREKGRTPRRKVVIVRNQLSLAEQRKAFDELRELEDGLPS